MNGGLCYKRVFCWFVSERPFLFDYRESLNLRLSRENLCCVTERAGLSDSKYPLGFAMSVFRIQWQTRFPSLKVCVASICIGVSKNYRPVFHETICDFKVLARQLFRLLADLEKKGALIRLNTGMNGWQYSICIICWSVRVNRNSLVSERILLFYDASERGWSLRFFMIPTIKAVRLSQVPAVFKFRTETVYGLKCKTLCFYPTSVPGVKPIWIHKPSGPRISNLSINCQDVSESSHLFYRKIRSGGIFSRFC